MTYSCVLEPHSTDFLGHHHRTKKTKSKNHTLKNLTLWQCVKVKQHSQYKSILVSVRLKIIHAIVKAHCLNPHYSRTPCTISYDKGKPGKKSIKIFSMAPPGFEPGIFCVWALNANHYTTENLLDVNIKSYL